MSVPLMVALRRFWVSQDYGAPATARINYTASGAGVVAVELTIFDKTATRLPEALYFQCVHARACCCVCLWGWFIAHLCICCVLL